MEQNLEISHSLSWLTNSLNFMNPDSVLQFSAKPENFWFVFYETQVHNRISGIMT